MTRRRWLVLVAVALVAATVAVTRTSGGNTTRDPAFVIGSRTDPYRIVYRLDDRSHDAVEPTTDVIWVRQPFESRLESRTGAPPGGALLSVQIAAIDRLRLGSIDAPLVIARVPGLAVSDVRVAPVLHAAVDAGLLEIRQQRTVAGRRCQVVRSGTLLGAGALVDITRSEYADSCIDAEGLLLEETLFIEGAATVHRVAVEVDRSPALDDTMFDAGKIVLTADQGGGSSRPVDPDVGAKGPYWVVPAGTRPDGFGVVGRYSVITPQTERFADPARAKVVAATADVFTRGVDFVVVHQGGTLGGVEAFARTPGAAHIDGGALGDGELVLSALGTELRFARPGGKFVHVIGTLGVDDLVALARQLVETEGTGLVYLDD